MKRNIFWVAAVLFYAAGFLSSCGDDDKDKDATIAVKSVTFSQSTVNVPLSDEVTTYTVALTFALEPVRANNIESVSWSSNAAGVATVTQSGLVTSIDLGEAAITVTVRTTDGNTFTDRCTVQVVPAPVGLTGVTFEDEELVLAPENNVTLVPVFSPADASNQNLIWESNNEKVATVSEDGVVTAVAEGTAVITATSVDGQYKARCTVSVRYVVTGVKFGNDEDISLEAGGQVTLIAIVLPEEATNKKVSWESSDTSVATVDENGKLTAESVGTATITVTTEDGEYEAAIEIEVLKTAVTGVELEDNTRMEIEVGSEVTLKADVLPDNATNRNVEWESSDPSVAVVDEDGKVTAKGVGTAVITVTTEDGGFQDSREFEVKLIPVTGVYLGNIFDPGAVRIVYERINSVYDLTAHIEPSDATIKEVTWESSDTDVAVVDENGKLSFKGIGKVTITVTTTEGGFKSSFVVNISTFYSWLDRSEWSIYGYTSEYAENRDGGPGWSSQAPYDGGARVTAILDDNDGAFWHASWSDPSTDYPHWFIVDMSEEVEFSEVMLRRRTNNGGTAKGYMVYTSNVANPPGNDSWIYRGDYTFDPGTDDRQIKPLDGGTVKARYILMYFDEKHKGSSNYTMFSQFGLYKRE